MTKRPLQCGRERYYFSKLGLSQWKSTWKKESILLHTIYKINSRGMVDLKCKDTKIKLLKDKPRISKDFFQQDLKNTNLND